MPLLGKIVVIKRNGADGTEFPLTASCLFGRKLDCDIRIQLPQVSKEHCRIELNENKELILTNLSSVNPTRINGEILQQSERLKHGDLITIIDRSFRFEYPPPPTPKKKRLSTSEKGETVKDQQVRSTPGPTDKKKIEISGNCLKDGSNLPSSLDHSIEPTKGNGNQQSKSNADSTMSPFSELYNMVKQDLASKSPWKSHPKSPLARPQGDKGEPKKLIGSENDEPVTPKSAKKNRRSSTSRAESAAVDNSETVDPEKEPLSDVQETTPAAQDSPVKQKRRSSGPVTPMVSEANTAPASQKKTPQATQPKFSASEVAQQILSVDPGAQTTPKSPKGRRSGASQPPAMTPKSQTTAQTALGPDTPIVSQSPKSAGPEESDGKLTPRTSPRTNAGKRFQVQDVVRELATTPDDKRHVQTSSRKHKCDDLPVPLPKRKRVSFGGQLSPELFDKRLPPNSPLRRGATPGRRSLGFSQKPQSLLRRASTIGLMGFNLDETVCESPTKNASPKRTTSTGKSPKASPGKSPKASPGKSPKASPGKSPSPAKKSPSTKVKSPSPKNQRNPPKTPTTPISAKRVSNASERTPLQSPVTRTPTVRGRFSITPIPTPSPGQSEEKEAPQKCVTPKIPLRRSSMKASARKTPKSALKSAFEVMRSRRSGASRANLKVVRSWADVVKFGQVKPQVECGTKKTATKQKEAKQTKRVKPKTPARRLKDNTSTGHADSPATVVIGRAYVRAFQPVGAAPKIVPNIALLKKDMKMDEDLTGVADIFKTPANSKKKGVAENDDCSETPLGVTVDSLTESSVMNTPEESGEMLVSPLSVASTAKLGCYNSEAVTRLLQDDQDVSLNNEGGPQTDDSANEMFEVEKFPQEEMEDEETEPQKMVQTPLQRPAASECLTGVKKLLRTPKQRSEPVEDLRGKLLKTPKEPKPTWGENFEGIKELLKTPKQKGAPVEDLVGLKRLMKTPKVKSSPVVCAVALKKLMNTPKDKAEQEEDLTGVKQLMQTPKLKGEPIEAAFGLKRLMKTPKQKSKPVEEDLTGIQQMMKTPKQRSKPVDDINSIQQLKTPKQKSKPVEDWTGIKQMMKTPKEKCQTVEEDLTGIQQMMKTPKGKSKPVEDLMAVQQLMKTPKQKSQPAEDLSGVRNLLQTPKEKRKPAENEFGISSLMETPRPGAGNVVEDITNRAELNVPINKSTPAQDETNESAEIQEPLTSDVAVDDVNEESEDKENICPTEVMKNETEANLANQVIPQMEMTEETKATDGTTDLGDEERSSVNMTSHEETGNVQGLPGQESVSETVGLVDVTPSLATAKKDEIVKMASSTKKTRGGRAKKKSPETESASSVEAEVEEIVPVEIALPVPAPMKGRRVKALQKPVPVQSPVRKSSRGKPLKCQLEEKEANDTLALETCQDVEQVPECPVESAKPRRGRKAEQSGVDIESVLHVNESSASSAVISLMSPVPAAKGKRVRKGKQELEQPLVIPAPQDQEEIDMPKAADEDVKDSSELRSSEAVDAPVTTNTRTRRGKPTKKETIKTTEVQKITEATPAVVELDVTSSGISTVAEDVPQKAVVKPGCGRRAKAGALKDIPVVDVPEAVVSEADVEPIQPAVKSARGTRSKQQKTDVKENAAGDVPKTEEHVAPVVKGGRRTKQPKAAQPEDAQENVEEKSKVEQSEAPAVKSVRGKRTVVEKDEPEAPVKRGRHGAAVEVPPPVVKLSRGRKAAVKAEVDIAKEKVVDDSEAAMLQESDPVGVSQASSEEAVKEDAVSEVSAKRGKGRYAKAKASTKDKAEDPAPVEQSEAVGNKRNAAKKAVNWKSDLVICKNIEESASPAAEDEPVPSSEESSVSETKQSADSPAKGRRGRVAKKPSEPPAEDNTPTVRRGRAAASSVSKPEELPASPKRATKRKGVDIGEDQTVESLPKRRKGKTASVEPETEVSAPRKGRRAAAKEVPEEVEAKAEVSAPSKGRRAAAKEVPEEVEAKAEVSALSKGRRAAAKDVPEEVEAKAEVSAPRKGRRAAAKSVPEEVEAKAEVSAPRKGRRAAAKEVPEVVPAKTEQSEAPSEEHESRPVRGKQKAAQELVSVPAQSEEPVSEASTRRGTRGQKKAEADVPSAPVRRTRRK